MDVRANREGEWTDVGLGSWTGVARAGVEDVIGP